MENTNCKYCATNVSVEIGPSEDTVILMQNFDLYDEFDGTPVAGNSEDPVQYIRGGEHEGASKHFLATEAGDMMVLTEIFYCPKCGRQLKTN